jgi:predicted TIM-barrel fold metal-dependent hydrolase
MNAMTKTASLFGGHKVIDVDTHLSEPHDLWISRAPASIKHLVPQVKMLNGQIAWVINDDISIGDGAPASSAIRKDGRKSQGMEFINFKMEDVHPGSSRIKERLEEMDASGISAQVVYPNLLGFGGQKAALVEPNLRLQCTTIYNDAMAEYQEQSGQRMFPMALLPWWDVKLAAQEAARCKAMGLRGININSDPHTALGLDGEKLPDLGNPYWYPLWEVCSDLDMSVNFHIGGSEQSMDWFGGQSWPSLSREQKGALGGAMLFFNNGRVMANLIYSGLLDKFPKLKFVSVESGIGWVPFLLEALDYQYREITTHDFLELQPSEYFQRNFYACFWFERKGIADLIRAVGVDNVMFETDFPHPTCLYPIDDVGSALAGLSNAEIDKVLSGNAQKVYNINV